MKMKFSSTVNSVLPLLFSIIFCGCVGTGSPPEPIYFYTLDYASPGPVFPSPAPFILKVERFSTSPPYNSQRIVYTDNGPHRNTYAYHQWIASPGDLLPYLLSRDLEFTRGFQGVFTPDSTIRSTHSVHGWIEQFLEIDTTEGWTASAIVHITLLADGVSDPSARVVLQRRYSAEMPCSSKTPAALAEAMAEAVSKISKAVSSDIYTALFD